MKQTYRIAFIDTNDYLLVTEDGVAEIIDAATKGKTFAAKTFDDGEMLAIKIDQLRYIVKIDNSSLPEDLQNKSSDNLVLATSNAMADTLKANPGAVVNAKTPEELRREADKKLEQSIGSLENVMEKNGGGNGSMS